MYALSDTPKQTPEEYLAFERAQKDRHEYLEGDVYAMAGASERHNLLASTLNFHLYGQLRQRPCSVFQSDMRVQTENAYFYPDLIVMCGEPQYADDKRDNLLNPTLIIEILSPTTEDFDKGRKFTQYRRIKSLQDYVLVAQSKMHIEHFSRYQADVWTLYEYTTSGQAIALPSIHATLNLADIYENIVFDTPPD